VKHYYSRNDLVGNFFVELAIVMKGGRKFEGQALEKSKTFRREHCANKVWMYEAVCRQIEIEASQSESSFRDCPAGFFEERIQLEVFDVVKANEMVGVEFVFFEVG
jgi:hypothetical protein